MFCKNCFPQDPWPLGLLGVFFVLMKNKASQALPIDKMLYIYMLCPHSEHQNNPFQSKQSKHFHQRNGFT